jgi:DNA-binding MarR family transcriptional regulator
MYGRERMTSPSFHQTDFDFRNPVDLDHVLRIGHAWIELRRGAGSAALREYFFGRHEPLEQGQMDALDLLVRRDRTMKGLAGRLRIDPSSATRAVQRVVKDGLAERYDSPEDGRVVMVRVTPKGRQRHHDVASRREIALSRIMAAFDPDERANLANLMDRLTTAINDVVETLDTET